MPSKPAADEYQYRTASCRGDEMLGYQGSIGEDDDGLNNHRQSHFSSVSTRAALLKNMEQLRNKSISKSPDRHGESVASGFATDQPASRLRQPNPYNRIDN